MALGGHWQFWKRRDTCGGIEPLLSLYVDGMTSAAETRRVESHLPDCAGCRQALAWMQATHQVIAARPPATPPSDLRARIAQAIAAAEAAKTPTPAPVRPVRRAPLLRPAYGYGFALALFAALSGTVYWSGHHGGPAPVTVVPQVHVADQPPASGEMPTVHSPIATPPKIHIVPHHTLSAHSSVIAARPAPTQPRAVHATPVVRPEPQPQTIAENVSHTVSLPSHLTLHATMPLLRTHPAKATPKPAHPSLLASTPHPAPHVTAPKPLVPAPTPSSSTVASLPQTPAVSAPEKITIGQPTLTPDRTNVAMTTPPPSLNETLHHLVAMNLSSVPLTARRVILSSKTAMAREAADVTSSSSGTVAITEGPIH